MQMKMLLSLGVEEVILAMDKQYDTKESEEKWLNKEEIQQMFMGDK